MTAPASTQAPPAGQNAAPAAKGSGQANTKNAPPPLVRPFVVGSRDIDKNDYTYTANFTSGTHFQTYQVSPNGYFSGLTIFVTVVAAGNSATVTFNANGPFNSLQSVQLADVNNKPFFGPVSGLDIYFINKYGGYWDMPGADARQSPVYTAVTGSGGTGGSFTYALDIPVEIVRRDAFGALFNNSSSSTYSVDIYSEAPTNVYGTTPTVIPTTQTVQIQLWGRSDPTQTDKLGNPVAQKPPAAGTMQYWSKQNYPLNAGAFDFRMLGIDNYVRNILFYLVDSAQSRVQGEADWPTPMTFQYETLQTMVRQKGIWQDRIYKWYGLTGTIDVAGARDSGVYPLNYNRDWSSNPGNETRLGYLPVSSGTNLELIGSIGGSGAHTLYALVNKIVPYGPAINMTGR